MSNILVNKIMTPDGTELHSTHRHDYVSHKDSVSGETYFTDGGNSYLRRSLNKIPYTDLTVYSDDSHEVKRENVIWGSIGPKGDQPLKWVKIKDLTTEHIQAILQNCDNVVGDLEQMFLDELNYRENNK